MLALPACCAHTVTKACTQEYTHRCVRFNYNLTCLSSFGFKNNFSSLTSCCSWIYWVSVGHIPFYCVKWMNFHCRYKPGKSNSLHTVITSRLQWILTGLPHVLEADQLLWSPTTSLLQRAANYMMLADGRWITWQLTQCVVLNKLEKDLLDKVFYFSLLQAVFLHNTKDIQPLKCLTICVLGQQVLCFQNRNSQWKNGSLWK